jgi:hypothetical protein
LCFLQFTIWLVLGQPGRRKFLQDITDKGGECKFWKEISGVPKPHENIQVWAKRVKSLVEENPAIWRVVELISERLLVPTLSNDDFTMKLNDTQMKSIALLNCIRKHQSSPKVITEGLENIETASKNLPRRKLKSVTHVSDPRSKTRARTMTSS